MSFFNQAAVGIVLLYGCASLVGITGIIIRHPFLRKIAGVCVAIAFALHTITFLMGSHAALPGGLSFGAYLQLLAWFVILCALATWWKWRVEAPLFFAAPLAIALFLLSWRYIDVQIRLPETAGGAFYTLHIGTLFLSLGLLALACGAGLLFIYLERKIKAKSPLNPFWKDFPALAILDKVNALVTVIGFPLYTIGMFAGFIWANAAFGTSISGDPKEIVSVIIWMLYAILFYMRMVLGLRGRKPALIAVCVFALSVFSFFVVNAFMHTHHSFMRP